MSLRLINTETSQLIREVSRKLDSILFPISDNNNLTIMKMKVLMEVSKQGRVNIGEIGQSLGVAGGNISNMCKNLENEGYLVRERSQDDERVVEVSLTDKGEKVLDQVRTQINDKYHPYDANITDNEYKSIVDSLRSLNKHLDNLLEYK
ncbi:MAG: MarR family transcriptional regulator [Gallicola sp.]|nr:MarR family transcriptional regulator [Gallicola sp.]